MAQANIIAIDGPAASGKSTVAKKLADNLGYLYFDTGVMYRAVTWQALSMGVDVGNEAAVTALAESNSIDVRPLSIEDGRDYDVWVDGQDVTWEIRRPEVEAHVSVVSAYPGVRAALSAPWQAKQLSTRIGRMSRLYSIAGSAAETTERKTASDETVIATAVRFMTRPL